MANSINFYWSKNISLLGFLLLLFIWAQNSKLVVIFFQLFKISLHCILTCIAFQASCQSNCGSLLFSLINISRVLLFLFWSFETDGRKIEQACFFIYQSLCKLLVVLIIGFWKRRQGKHIIFKCQELFFKYIAYFLLLEIIFKLHTINKTSQAEMSLLVIF